ncbi:MAG: sugar phosphate nucleotidyltransferase, partial [Candidatus Saccharimonadales bacterium]
AHLIGDEPFIYTYADDLMVASPNCFQQMIDLHMEFQGGIFPCIKVTEDEEFHRYGMLGGDQIRDDVIKMTRIIEKPGRAASPSNLAGVGGCLLTPDVFSYLEKGLQNLKPGQEFHLTDCIIQPMLQDGKNFYGCEIKNNTRYDTGTTLEYLKTVVNFALSRDDIGADFRKYLEQLIRK